MKPEHRLDSPLGVLSGIGDSKSALFAKLNVFTLCDLLQFYPLRYENRAQVKKIFELTDGETCSIMAFVAATPAEVRGRSGIPYTKVCVSDDTGEVYITFFNNKWIAKSLSKGRRFRIYGKFTLGMYGRECVNPIMEAADTAKALLPVVPVYSLTAGLNRNTVQSVIRQVLPLAETLPEALDPDIISEFSLMKKSQAVRAMHYPADENELSAARYRLAFEELYLFQLRLRQVRLRSQSSLAYAMSLKNTKIKGFFDSLGFELTRSQQRVIKEIFEDMSKPTPMSRLLQGDVGSGKTVVAAAAIYYAVKNGFQAVMMAPTEILASQHYLTLTRMFSRWGINVGLLTGSLSARDRKIVASGTGDGSIQVLVGTHAVIEKDLAFLKLGLVITDEQHRFGVSQRRILAEKNPHAETPHALAMSATPIPRTLCLCLYGDLDVSVIDELPPGRKPISTFAFDEDARQRLYGFIKKQVDAGYQAYVVCPLVEESETLERKSASSHYDSLQRALPGYKIGLLHGKQTAKEKSAVMQLFKNNHIQILVSTTVIEVGVDVPNATVMVVENAECFGLSTLHQLRGRIGRGKGSSYCILMYDKETPKAKERLEIMCGTSNGFEIAEADLRLRGPGEFFGQKQSGELRFRVASSADMELIELTGRLAGKNAGLTGASDTLPKNK